MNPTRPLYTIKISKAYEDTFQGDAKQYRVHGIESFTLREVEVKQLPILLTEFAKKGYTVESIERLEW